MLAGFDEPEKAGIELLSKDEVAEKIRCIFNERKKGLSVHACSGYERLAFGSIADAVSLMFCENPTHSELERLDLFNVAEIKRPKEGAMEIKFFDRLRALEKLEQLEGSDTKKAPEFYQALINGAKAIESGAEIQDEA